MSRGNRIKETTTTTGLTTFNLGGAVAKFITFIGSSTITSGDTVKYWAINDTDDEWERGEGVITDATPDTLTRVTIFNSSNGDAKVDFTTSPVVFVDVGAEDNFTKIVTDTTDISLGDIASTQSNFGASFPAMIPTEGLIKISNALRLQADSAAFAEMQMGIRISSVNYWPHYLANGTVSYAGQMRTPNTSGQYQEGFGDLGSFLGGISQAMDIAKMGIPSGLQTVQIVVARRDADTATIKGTVVTSRAFIEIMDGN